MKILGKIIAVLYSIIFTLAIVLVSILITSSNLLRGDFYTELLTNVDLKEISASDLGLSEEEGTNLEDALVDKLTDFGFTESASVSMLQSKEIKEVLGNVIGQVINYNINKGDAPKVTKDQVKVIFDNEEVKKTLDADFSDEDINELVENINEMLLEFTDLGGSLNGD